MPVFWRCNKCGKWDRFVICDGERMSVEEAQELALNEPAGGYKVAALHCGRCGETVGYIHLPTERDVPAFPYEGDVFLAFGEGLVEQNEPSEVSETV